MCLARQVWKYFEEMIRGQFMTFRETDLGFSFKYCVSSAHFPVVIQVPETDWLVIVLTTCKIKPGSFLRLASDQEWLLHLCTPILR